MKESGSGERFKRKKNEELEKKRKEKS